MNNLLEAIKTNRVLNILLNPEGTITRKEYWLGILLLLLLTSLPYYTSALSQALLSASYNSYRGDDMNLIMSSFSALYGFRNIPLIPYSAIVLYASFILTFKRSRGTFHTLMQWALGLFTWLSLISLTGMATLVTYQYSYTYFDLMSIVMPLTLLAFFMLGIISILILSFCKNNNDNTQTSHSSSHDSLNYLSKWYALQIIFVILCCIRLLFIINPYQSSTSPLLVDPIIIFLVIFQLVGFVYLTCRRAMDAGLNLYIPLAAIGTAFILAGFYCIVKYIGLMEANAFVNIVVYTGISFALSIYNVLLVILIALPTKEEINISSDEQIH